MKVNLKCFADLAERYTCDYQESKAVTVEKGATVSRVLDDAGIPENEVRIVFVNGQVTRANQILNEGDRVTLVPATGGM